MDQEISALQKQLYDFKQKSIESEQELENDIPYNKDIV